MTSGCKNQWGLRLWKTNHKSPRQFLLKGPCIDLLRLTPSELRHRSKIWKGTRAYREESKCLASRQLLGGSFLPDRSAGRVHCSFSKPSPNRAGRQAPYLRHHQPGSHCLPHPADSLRLCPTNFQAHPSCFQWLFHMNGLS